MTLRARLIPGAPLYWVVANSPVSSRSGPMNVAQVAAEILKREGVEVLLAYPLNPLTESAAAAGIRPVIVRQERVGIHMADAISRLTAGDKVGVFCCQAGPGVENSFGAVAQAWSEGVPLIVIPGASARS